MGWLHEIEVRGRNKMWKRMSLPAVFPCDPFALGGTVTAQVLNVAIPQDPDSFDPHPHRGRGHQ